MCIYVHQTGPGIATQILETMGSICYTAKDNHLYLGKITDVVVGSRCVNCARPVLRGLRGFTPALLLTKPEAARTLQLLRCKWELQIPAQVLRLCPLPDFLDIETPKSAQQSHLGEVC